MLAKILSKGQPKDGRLIQLLPDWHIEPVDLHLSHASHEQLPERVRSLLDYLEAEIPQEIHKLDLGQRSFFVRSHPPPASCKS